MVLGPFKIRTACLRAMRERVYTFNNLDERLQRVELPAFCQPIHMAHGMQGYICVEIIYLASLGIIRVAAGHTRCCESELGGQG